MPDFGIMRGFNDKLFGDKLVAGQLQTQLGLIGSQDVSLLLLDIYPNAAAAYSVRKLRLAYTGSAIRVRRTDLTESDIGFTSAGNLDTTALLAFTGTGALDNGFVTTWYDQSGNARNSTQTTATNQPQIVSAGSVILENSNPTLQFDGINDFFNTGNKLLQLNTTLIAAFNFTRENVTGALLGQWSSGTAGRTLITTNQNIAGSSQSNNLSFFNSTSTGIVDIVAPSGMNLIFWNIATGSGNYQVFNNGTNKYNATITSIATNVNTAIGVFSESSIISHFDGVLSELILWPAVQTSRVDIETNLNDFYSIY